MPKLMSEVYEKIVHLKVDGVDTPSLCLHVLARHKSGEVEKTNHESSSPP